VATNPEGLVEWVNPAFMAMCGYSLEELKGRKPGRLLQGPDTDPTVVERIRQALRARSACRETLLNYHKDGSRYRVEVSIDPILDDEGQPLWFVARERKLPSDGAVAAG
jgi:PAS domain S-box-containing protein